MRRSHSECFDFDPGVPIHSARAKMQRQVNAVAAAEAVAQSNSNESSASPRKQPQLTAHSTATPVTGESGLPWGIAQIEAKRWRPADPNHTPSKKKIMVGPTNVQAIKLDDEIKKRKFDPPYLRVYPYKDPIHTFPDYANGRAMELGTPVDAISANAEQTKIVVAGTKVLQIFDVSQDRISPVFDLKANKRRNGLLYAPSNVAWSKLREDLIATCSPMGGVVIWNASHEKNGIPYISTDFYTSERDVISYKDHNRSATAVHFHRTDENLLISGSVDSLIKLYDLRVKGASVRTYGLSRLYEDTIRDLTFGIHPGMYNLFFTAGDVGVLRMWDIRIQNKPILQIGAHHGYIGSIALNAQDKNLICTGGGRDRLVKVWDLGFIHDDQRARYVIETVAPVNRVYWRPDNPNQIVTCAVVNDTAVHIWDVRRSHVPYASFEDHADGVTDIWWSNIHPTRFITSGKDGCLILHRFTEAFRPLDFACDVPHDQAPDGLIAVAVSTEYKAKIVNEMPPVPPAVRTPATYTVDVPQKKGEERSRRQRGLRRSVHYEPYRAPIASDVAVGLPDMAALTLPSNIFAHIADLYSYENFPPEQLCLMNNQIALRVGAKQQAYTWRCLQMLFYISPVADIISNYLAKQNEEERVRWKRQVRRFEIHWASGIIPICLAEYVSWMFPELLSPWGNSDAGRSMVIAYRSAIEEACRFNPRNLDVFDANEFFYGHSEGFSSEGDYRRRAEAPHTNDFEGLDEEPFEMRYTDLKNEYWFREPTANWRELPSKEDTFNIEVLRFIDYHLKKLDLQTVVALVTMLGPIVMKKISIYRIETWTNAYIEMLERSKLYSAAARIRRASVSRRVGNQTREGTEQRWVHVNCSMKGIITNGVCTSCKQLITPTCNLCHAPIVGMVWCCGECLHSFHPEHAAAWFQTHEICSASDCICNCTASTWPLYPQGNRAQYWSSMGYLNSLMKKKGFAIKNYIEFINRPKAQPSPSDPYSQRGSLNRADTAVMESLMRRPPKTPSMSEQHLKSLIQELPANDNDTIGKDSDAASISDGSITDIAQDTGHKRVQDPTSNDKRRISTTSAKYQREGSLTPQGSWTQKKSILDTPTKSLRKKILQGISKEEEEGLNDYEIDSSDALNYEQNDAIPVRKRTMPIEMEAMTEGRAGKREEIKGNDEGKLHRHQSTSPVTNKVTRVMERLFRKSHSQQQGVAGGEAANQSDATDNEQQNQKENKEQTDQKKGIDEGRHAKEKKDEVKIKNSGSAETKKLFITSEASHSIEKAVESDDEKRRSTNRSKPRRKSEILPSERKKAAEREREKGTTEIRDRKDSLRLRLAAGNATPTTSHPRDPRRPGLVSHSVSQPSPGNTTPGPINRSKSAIGPTNSNPPGTHPVISRAEERNAIAKQNAIVCERYFGSLEVKLEHRVKFNALPLGYGFVAVDGLERIRSSSKLLSFYEKTCGRVKFNEYLDNLGKIVKKLQEPGECWVLDEKGIVLPVPISYGAIRDKDSLDEAMQKLKRKREKLQLNKETYFWTKIDQKQMGMEDDEKIKVFCRWNDLQLKKIKIETKLKGVEIPKHELVNFCPVFIAFNRNCEPIKALANVEIERISNEFKDDFLWKRSLLKKLHMRSSNIFSTNQNVTDQIDSSKLFENLSGSEKSNIFKMIDLESWVEKKEIRQEDNRIAAASIACRTAKEIYLRYEQRDVQKVEDAREITKGTIGQLQNVLYPKYEITNLDEEIRERVLNCLHHGEAILNTDFKEPRIESTETDSVGFDESKLNAEFIPDYRNAVLISARRAARRLFSTYLKFMLWSASIQSPATLAKFTSYMRKERRFKSIFKRIDECWRLDDIKGVWKMMKSECDKLWTKCFEGADRVSFEVFSLRIVNLYLQAFKLPKMLPPSGHSEGEFYGDMSILKECTGDDSIRISKRTSLYALMNIMMQLPLMRQQMQIALQEVQLDLSFQQLKILDFLDKPLKGIRHIKTVDWGYFEAADRERKGIFKVYPGQKLLKLYEEERDKSMKRKEETVKSCRLSLRCNDADDEFD